MTAALITAFIVALLAACLHLARRNGQAQERLSKEEEIDRAVEKARLARSRLDRDADYARRVRDAFTRKLLPDLRAGADRAKGHGKNQDTGGWE